MIGASLREAADSMVAIAGELGDSDAEIAAAVRKLREVCAEHDEVSDRFETAAADVKRLLLRAVA